MQKKQNVSKKSPEVSIDLPESQQEVSIDLPDELPENIREDIVEKEPNKEVIAEESHIERIERHAERQQFNDHINNLIDERVQYKPIVKSKYKMMDGSYVIR